MPDLPAAHAGQGIRMLFFWLICRGDLWRFVKKRYICIIKIIITLSNPNLSNPMSIFKEFKDFAMKGNVVDMAVGVIIGAAFGKIVSSLVDDIIMPLVGVATGGMNFTDLKWVVQKGITEGETVIQPEVTMNYGAWIQTIVDFIIVAFCIFIMIKFMNQLRRKKEEEAAAPAPAPEPTKEEQLLTEIRDILKSEQK